MLGKVLRRLSCMILLAVSLFAAGCASDTGSGLHRLTGLTPDAVVTEFFNAAKANHLDEAALYVSPVSKTDVQTALKFMSGENGIEQIKNANLLSVKIIAAQGNYAAVVATLQQNPNSFNLVVRPIGMEKINDEWYIVDSDQIAKDAKYSILQTLLSKIQ